MDLVDTEYCLKELVSLRLVEPYDPSASVLNDSQRIAITYKGLVHFELSTRNSVYFYQMAITTAISDPEIALDIRNYYKSSRPFGEITSYIRKQFSNYLIQEDSKYLIDIDDKEQFICQKELIKDIQSFGVGRNGWNRSPQDNYSSFFGEKLIGNIKTYDPEKDFGFMSLAELNEEVYFKVSKLEKNELQTVYDGDIVYCTLGQGDKGIQIKTIDGFVEGRNEFQIEKCSIKTYKPERGFGFSFIGSTSNEAFFHKTAFPSNFYEYLVDGLEFLAEIRLNDDGKYQIRRCIELIK